MKKQIQLSAAAEGALRKLGKGIKTARIKKGITATSMAELMDTTRVTLGSIEDGLPSVSMDITSKPYQYWDLIFVWQVFC